MNREPEATADEQAGTAWWNSLTEDQRAHGLQVAGAAVPAEAWAAYKQSA